MAITALQYLTLRAPSYSSDTRVADLLVLAENFTGCLTGDPKEMAKALQVLHWLTISDRTGGGSASASTGVGAIQSEKEGDLEISYGKLPNTNSTSSNDLSQTPWGLELEALLKTCMVFPRTRFSCGATL